jgi:hypothetical protein
VTEKQNSGGVPTYFRPSEEIFRIREKLRRKEIGMRSYVGACA